MSQINLQVVWKNLLSTLNETDKRRFAALRALELGHGGIQMVHEITGIARSTISTGVRELQDKRKLHSFERQRVVGAGRKKTESYDKKIITNIEQILSENTAGNPMSSLVWTHKSCRTLAEELLQNGHVVNKDTVARLLHELGYSLQANRKEKENTKNHKDRDSQFLYINECVNSFMTANDPVISIDAKKKELVGNFKNDGKTWRRKGDALAVNAYDFPSWADGKAAPYGIYDRKHNKGVVNVGISKDTAEFAVNSIRLWWGNYGRHVYPQALRLLICADSGGSNSAKGRLWKHELQKFSNERKFPVSVCHYPPGTSKWNAIEHRMFSFISLNWQGKPLESFEMIVNLIANTVTKKGLSIQAFLDEKQYDIGIQVSKKDFDDLNIASHKVNAQWNYTISPQTLLHQGN